MHYRTLGLLAIAAMLAGSAPRSFSPGPHAPRAAQVSLSIGGLVHVVGGGDLQEFYSDHLTYDENGWRERAALPSPRLFAAITTLDGAPVVLGGISHDNDWNREVWRYDPKSDSWQALPPMPSGRNRFAAATLDGKVYAIGGYEDRQGVREVSSPTVDRFDPATGEWQAAPPMPAGLHGHTACVIDKKLYVAGGYAANVQTDALHVFDPETDQWRSLAPMPQPNGFHMSVVDTSRLFVIGGRVVEPSPCSAYDPDTDTWERLAPMPGIRGRGSAVVVGDEIWVLGGEDRQGRSYPVDEPLRFNLETGAWIEP